MDEVLVFLRQKRDAIDALLAEKKYQEAFPLAKALFTVLGQQRQAHPQTEENAETHLTLLLETAVVSGQLGICLRKAGNGEDALRFFKLAIRFFELIIPPPTALYACYNNLGGLFHEQGDRDMAIAYYERALQGTETAEITPELKAIWHNNLGTALAEKEELDKAIPYLRQALRFIQESPNRDEEANIRNNLGVALSDSDNFTEALAMHQSALELAQQYGFENHAENARQQIILGRLYGA
jgi:tetratricopeptide (TPR) repeat protein